MPLAKPKPNESKDDFLYRCMRNEVMIEEFPKRNQRWAVCNKQWKKDKKQKNE